MSDLKAFHFHQNNSGGAFDIDAEKGIGVDVFIVAESTEQAVEHAQSIGIYFNGVEEGYDCECCGDRWYEPWNRGDVADIPKIVDGWGRWTDKYFVHKAADGTFEAFDYPEESK